MEKIVGVIGGMGPEATVDFMRRVLEATPAGDDCDHVRMIVDNNPKIPSRLKALLDGTGADPGPCLIEMAQKLEAWGADFLAMPCNTAHYYHGRIQNAVAVPVLNMIDLTVAAIVGAGPGTRITGVLCSPAVLKIGLYERRLQERGVAMAVPGPVRQQRLFEAIKRIKAGDKGPAVVAAAAEAVRDLEGQGASAIVVACTELSVVAATLSSAANIHDATQILATAVVREAKAFVETRD